MVSESIEIRGLSSCTFSEALTAWNEGFQGYFIDMTLSLDGYLSRLQREGVSPEYSLIAFSAGRPVGFLLNGLRTIAGEVIAWNGGTGVSPEFRGRGVGKALMLATFDLYQERAVSVATLEALSDNHSAISLYQKFGYEIIDRLVVLEHEGRLDSNAFAEISSHSFSVDSVPPQAVGALSFYVQSAPWQTQYQSLIRDNGEALIVYGVDGIALGYALYKRKFDEQGELASIILYQCVAEPDYEDSEAVVRCALKNLFAPFEVECRRATHNLGKPNLIARRVLEDCGFTTYLEQVQMARRMTL